jgi:hypothetical protein
MDFAAEAEACRQEALRHLGKPEAPFLLRIARSYDDLARREHRSRPSDEDKGHSATESRAVAKT